MKLIIVESPTKSKTIQKFLSPEFKALSSYGHVRDLKARKVIKTLKEEVKKAELIILATDEDREGEAIAWHLSQVLDLNEENQYQRIVFHEITKPAIEEALKNPRKINISLVNAQQARRILDRIVGYKLSPFLWKKVMRRLSAGRVQSVTVRLIAAREEEIKNFTSQEYWEIKALFEKDKKDFEAILIKKDDKAISKLEIKNKEEADKIIEDLEEAEYKIKSIERKETARNPLPPFTTSTLQQESWKRFRFPARFTMRIAQNLYEKGFITYHRTDSLNLSNLSLFAAKKFIIEKYGEEYWAGYLRKYKARGKVQEAHEAIRPTYPDKEPDELKIQAKLDNNQLKLYNLIWRRFIACQMASAIFDSVAVDIDAKKYTFKATGQTLKFEGFLKVYLLNFKETELPLLEENEILKLIRLEPSQHFTQPPPRFTEATLIKELEKNGIGRPSTYAPILATIQERNYVEKNEQKRFQPTEIGIIVDDLLVKHFPKIVDLQFTAEMEEDLDEVANNKKEWTKILKNFYDPFEKNLLIKEKEVVKKDLTEKTEKTCPKCKKGEVIKRKTKRGKIFYGCSTFPECNFASWEEPINKKCPECNSFLIKTKNGKVKCPNKDCNYSE